MARYIECEVACAEIDKGDLLVGNNAEFAKEIINRTPAADVAPKSEVEYLKEHLEIWCEKYKKAIEKNDVLTDKCEVLYNELLVERCKNAKLFEELEYFSNDERFIKSQWYAELKKKYTEENK